MNTISVTSRSTLNYTLNSTLHLVNEKAQSQVPSKPRLYSKKRPHLKTKQTNPQI